MPESVINLQIFVTQKHILTPAKAGGAAHLGFAIRHLGPSLF